MTEKQIVIVKEMSAGNESIGTEWLESKIFSEDSTLRDVLQWKKSSYGRLMIVEPHNEICGKD